MKICPTDRLTPWQSSVVVGIFIDAIHHLFVALRTSVWFWSSRSSPMQLGAVGAGMPVNSCLRRLWR
jgi:hypothetical protein